MKKIGNYEISAPVLSSFRLDGGAMFGCVPKNIWQKWIEADGDNCIQLVCRSLLLRGHGRTILVDTGMGEKWNDKLRRIYQVENYPTAHTGVIADEITDIIITHLHFDHSGGLSRYNTAGNLELCYPLATVHLQRANFETGRAPNLHEKASYLSENIEVLLNGELHIIEGAKEIFPGLWVHEIGGHTKGLQYIEIKDPDQPLLYAGDLIPTSQHLPVHFTMGYDMNAELVMEEKEAFLSYAEQSNAIVVFEHDPHTAAARIGRDSRENYAIKETLLFD